MALSNYKLGDLIELNEIYNINEKFGMEYVRGISNAKQIMMSKADVDPDVIKKFYVVYPGEFVYNPRTTRMGEKVGLGFNNTSTPLLFSFNNIAFRIKECAKMLIIPEYLYLFYNRPEFDRYAITNSWGSATELFTFDEMCDIDIELPPLPVQQKYVDVYNAMLANQKSYERGLDDLKLTCDAYIENLRRKIPCEPIGQYINIVNEVNSNREIKHVQGVEASGAFMDTRANMLGVDIAKYTIVRKYNFAYNPARINIGSIALYSDDKPCIVSPMYQVFTVINTEKIIPEYLMLWFGRCEFQRYTWYFSVGSVRDIFDFNLMKEVELPLPDTDLQQDIINIYKAYKQRKAINERLKLQIKNICPILIKGSIEEAEKEA